MESLGSPAWLRKVLSLPKQTLRSLPVRRLDSNCIQLSLLFQSFVMSFGEGHPWVCFHGISLFFLTGVTWHSVGQKGVCSWSCLQLLIQGTAQHHIAFAHSDLQGHGLSPKPWLTWLLTVRLLSLPGAGTTGHSLPEHQEMPEIPPSSRIYLLC